MRRGNGVLLHLSSLPSEYGYGSLGKPAFDFIDKLKQAGQSYWQMLPCSPPGLGNNPYQGDSAFAGNPYYIDVERLAEEGLLEKSDLKDFEPGKLNSLLYKAYKNGFERFNTEFTHFKYENAFWLFDYSLYFAEKMRNDGKPLANWGVNIATRQPEEMVSLAQECKGEIECTQFTQFLYQRQWWQLKNYANRNGISIIGEIPFYINVDSADAWAYPENLILDGSYVMPSPWVQADDAHIHGNPPYNWGHMALHGYDWWMARIKHWENMFDYLTIDHMASLLAYFVMKPGADEPALEMGPGYAFHDTLCYHVPDAQIIAGDTALSPDGVDFLRNCGFIRLMSLQKAFEGTRRMEEMHVPGMVDDMLPHSYERNCVCTTGLPDGSTTRSWYMQADKETKDRMKDYFGSLRADGVSMRMIRLAMGSIADVCIVPMQDMLNLTDEAKMYDPVGKGGGFDWVMHEKDFDSRMVGRLKTLAGAYGRL